MKKEIYYCDRCGAQSPEHDLYRIFYNIPMRFGCKQIDCEVCKRCVQDIHSFVKNGSGAENDDMDNV